MTLLLTAWMSWLPAKRFVANDLKEDELRVVTWNVGYFSPVTNKNVRDIDLDVIASLLTDVTPDVVILQELASIEQAQQITQILGPNWFCHSAKTGHGEQVIAILSASEFLTTDSFECGGRMTLGASLQTRTNQSLYVVGVHSPHPARGVAENIENIKCALDHATARSEDIRIITGDMNCNFDPNGTGAFYAEILEQYGDGTIDLGETYYAQTRIDHMFHHPKDLRVTLDSSGMIDLPMRFAKVPGFRDHKPIVVTYDLK